MKFSQKAVSVIGKLLMLASFAFIGRQVLRYDTDFSILASPFVITGLLLTALACGASIVLAGLNYKWIIGNVTDVSLEPRLVIRVYCTSNMYKYIPGTVMYLIGRNRIALETNKVNHTQIALATAVEGIFILLSAVILIAVSVHEEAVSYMRYVGIPIFVWIIIGAVVFIVVSLAIILRRRLQRGLKKFTDVLKNFSVATKAKRLGVAMLVLVVLAVTYLVTLMLLGQQVTLAMVPTIIGLYLLSWLAGFLTPGTTSGMGVREAVLLMFLGVYLDPGIVVSSAIIHRVICIVGDVFAYGIAFVYSKSKK
ncbi:MAG: hypothetical protein FWB78_07770 [Treponema sp.]|nr:hypothetical protein [Treponema sp.]